MSQYTLPFTKLTKKQVGLAGGKGANLGEMTAAGLPVPAGFVILATAFNRFLEETDINVEIEAELNRLNYRDLTSVDRFSHEIRDVIHRAALPPDLKKEFLATFDHLKAPFVAVRSSATAEDSQVASWAGELETYLFIKRGNFLKTVKRCWSSLFTPRAIFYRFEKKLHRTEVSVAVVVQQMVNSEKSGVCFTGHPVTKDRNQMVIEAGWGLGEAIVSGMITPDTYVVSKRERTILDINISHQEKMVVAKPPAGGTRVVTVKKTEQDRQILSGQQILELADICQRIERHYNSPQDIEWALESNKFCITQTRPITTL